MKITCDGNEAMRITSETAEQWAAREQQRLQDYAQRQMADSANNLGGLFGYQAASNRKPDPKPENALGSRESELAARNAYNLAKWKKRWTAYVTNIDFQHYNQFAAARRSYVAQKGE